MLAGSLLAAGAVAQTVATEPATSALNIPTDPEFFAAGDPNVRKATAIVNGHVITGTDLDHRVALVVLANGGRIPPEEMLRLRAQVLRNLIDETLQIQAAEREEITVEPREIDAYYEEYARSFNRAPAEFTEYLKSVGSSERSIKRQIQAEVAWGRLQNRRIEPFVDVGQEEVQAIIDRMQASRGEQKFRVGEIFISATPETAAVAQSNAERIVQQLRQGASFMAYARQFSEASTAAVGGDLGWVSAEQLPAPLDEAVTVLPVGQVSNPIAIPGGFSILVVQDKRRELMPDERDAILSLKQISINFPAGTTEAQATPLVERLARTVQNMGGCGQAEQAAASIGAEVVTNDQIRVGDLPPLLQEMLLNLNIGQATSPFGSVEEQRVSMLVLCGRDDPEQAAAPSFEQVYNQLNEQRVNQRARRFLRDLRRDAVVDYR